MENSSNRDYSSHHNRSAEFIVRLTSRNKNTFKGTLEHLESGQVLPFDSLMEFIILVQAKLDEMGFPQADTEIRTWKE